MAFVGRVLPLAAVDGALEAAAGGLGTLIAVEGEAGIGKTAVLDEALRRWQRRPERTVVRAKADELGSSAPFATLAAAFGVEPGATTAEALLDRASRVVAEVPLAIAIDDAQWLDAASTLLLARLLDELTDHPLAVVATLRPLPQSPELATLVARPHRTHVVLPPMARAELEELVAAAGCDATTLPLDQVGGNPLYALELAAASGAEGAGTVALAPPLSVTILRRLSYLADTTVGILRRAALLGAAVAVDDLVLVADVDERSALDGIAEAIRAGVLREEGLTLAFSHDLVRQALYDDVPAPLRRFEHVRIARALAAAGRPASSVATHFERGAVAGDLEAVSWLRRAAQEVAPRSAETAIGLLERALALEPADPEVRSRTAAELCVQLGTAGRFDELLELAPPVLADAPDDEVAVAAAISLAQALNGRARSADACRLLEERAASASTEHRARLLGMLASTRLTDGDAEGALRAADEGMAAAEASGSAHWIDSIHAVRSWLATGSGDPDAGIELAERALYPDVDHQEPFAAVFDRLALGAAFLEAERIPDAIASFARAVAVADASGMEANVTLAHLGLALCGYAAGDLDAAATEAETALARAARGSNRTSDLYALGLLARIAVHRHGAAAVAGDAVQAATRALDARGPGLGAEVVVWAAAAAAEAAGREPDVDLVALVWQLHPLRALLTWRMLAPDLTRWAVAAHRRDLALQVADDVDAIVATTAVGSTALPSRRAMAARCRALARGDTGALLGGSASGRPLERAAATLDGARLALAASEREAATSALRAAVASFDALGAIADADAARDLARRHRIRTDAKGAVPAGAADGDARPVLTAAEREVARLAAHGLTNRAIGTELAMSRHTVDTHLRHVYRKLEIAGRVELARHPAVS